MTEGQRRKKGQKNRRKEKRTKGNEDRRGYQTDD
jgi:hypothetical protein